MGTVWWRSSQAWAMSSAPVGCRPRGSIQGKTSTKGVAGVITSGSASSSAAGSVTVSVAVTVWAGTRSRSIRAKAVSSTMGISCFRALRAFPLIVSGLAATSSTVFRDTPPTSRPAERARCSQASYPRVRSPVNATRSPGCRYVSSASP